MRNKTIIIFSGYNQRAVISFCRFAKSENIDFFIIAKNINDTILKSIYKNNVIYIRKSIDLDINEIIDCTKQLNTIHN